MNKESIAAEIKTVRVRHSFHSREEWLMRKWCFYTEF